MIYDNDMDGLTTERIKGLVGAGILHLLLVLLLIFTYMKPFQAARPSMASEGVPVMLGNAVDAFGHDDPKGTGDGTSEADVDASAPVPPVDAVAGSTKPSVPTATNPSNAVTQSHTKTVDVQTDAQKNAETKRRADAEALQKAEKEAARKAQIESETKKNVDNIVGGAIGKGTGGGLNKGSGSGPGNTGASTGNSNTGASSGIGGTGTSYTLSGRNPASNGLVKPIYPNVNEGGIVVVDIIVNPSGTVISALAGGKGTNTSNSALRNAATRAAQQTKFNAINSPNNQSGTITYHFNLKTN